MRFTVRADQDPEVICRAAHLAYNDADVLELVPVAGLPDLTVHVQQHVEDYAHRKGFTLAEAERWLSPSLGYRA